jgi:hypothetical protein
MVELCGDLVIRVYNSLMTINTPTLFAGGSANWRRRTN